MGGDADGPKDGIEALDLKSSVPSRVACELRPVYHMAEEMELGFRRDVSQQQELDEPFVVVMQGDDRFPVHVHRASVDQLDNPRQRLARAQQVRQQLVWH